MPMKHKAVIEKIKRQLREEIEDINRDAATAVYAIGMEVIANAAAKTPRDTGTPIGGYYDPQVSQDDEGAHCTVGNTVRYAFWVHEMPGTLKGQPREHFGKTREGIAFGGGTGRGEYWEPDGEPEFLKKALGEEYHSEYMDIAKRYLKR